VEALAATPIDKIGLHTGRDVDNTCGFEWLLKALLAALESKTLKATHWNLSRMPRFHPIEAIAKFLKSTAIITDLDLSENAFGDKGAEEMAEVLKENRTLKRLNLAHTGIGVRGVEALKKALQTNTTLEQLELDERSGIEAEAQRKGQAEQQLLQDLQTKRKKEEEEKGLLGRMMDVMETGGLITQDTPQQAIEAACRANPRICKPSAAQSEANEEPFKSPLEAAVRIKGLADQLRLNKIFRYVDLTGENICDDKMKALAAAFRVNKTVDIVDLCRNNFGDEGVKALADAFRVNRTIRSVDLRYNNFGDEGLKALASAMEVNGNITHVGLVMEGDLLARLSEEFRQAQAHWLAMLSDEGRQAMEDIKRFCRRNGGAEAGSETEYESEDSSEDAPVGPR